MTKIYETLMFVGFSLVIVGFLLVFAFITLNAASAKTQSGTNSTVQGGGVILIGPIPIIFGTNSSMAVVAGIIGIVLFVLGMLFYFFLMPH